MNDRPSFLGYDGEDLRNELVRTAQADAAPAQAQRRVMSRVTGVAAGAGIGFAAVGTAAATSAAKATVAVTAASLTKWIAIGLATGTVAVVAIEKTRPPVAAPAVTAVVQERSAPVVQAQRAQAPRVEAPAVEVAAPAVISAARRTGERVQIDEPEQLPEPEATAQEPTVLAKELARLEDVRQAMAQGRPARALDLLGRYDREFTSGSMASEAAALRVEALVRAGRREEAQDAARAFLVKYPRSPLSDRVRVAAGL